MTNWIPQPGDPVRWTNCPPNCIKRGDGTGILDYRDGDYFYVKLKGTRSLIELYLCELAPLDT